MDLQIRFFGEFSIELDGKQITDNDNRTKKIWTLLAYLIYRRDKSISQEELIQLLWGDEAKSSNPLNALKTIFHRARILLNQLDGSAGHRLIIRRKGNYSWSSDVPLTIDADEFEVLCKQAASANDENIRLKAYLEALNLYKGDFLPKLSGESWIVPISAYFHNLYISAVSETLVILKQRNMDDEIIRICRNANEIDPYYEPFYQHYMQSLMNIGAQNEVVAVYEKMNQLLFDNFGIMPSEASRMLYREAIKTVNDRTLSFATIREQLDEPDDSKGALICEYDFFKMIYRSESRSVARSGSAVHLALLSISSKKEKELSKRSLDCCIENLEPLICSSLRKSDTASRCSISQYVFLLPQSNYENACKVCDRIIKFFHLQYPHSPAALNYFVQPLEPNI